MDIQIGQDIRKFKTKDIGTLSFKEAAFVAVGVGLGAIVYKTTGSMEYAIPPVMIVLLFGFFKPYGMSFWTFLKTVMAENLSTQCYINETDFEYNIEEFPELYGEDVVIPANWDVIQTNQPAKINKKDKQRIAT